MALAIGSDKTISNTYYANGKLFAGNSCRISHNATHATYYKEARVFLDLMKQSGNWRDDQAPPPTSIAYDSDGWITQLTGTITKIIVHDTELYDSGDYIIEYSGTATIDLAGRTLTSISTGKYSFNLPSTVGGFKIWLSVTDGTFSNCRVYKATDEAKLNSGQIWTDAYIAMLQEDDTIRFMDHLLTNGSPIRHPSHISTLNASTWTQGFSNHGIPPEAIASLCNATMARPWINIPHQSTDATVTSFITRLNASLNVALSVIVEYSNEIAWNFGTAFRDQFRYCFHGDAPTREATLSGGVFTQVAHGMSSGDEVVVFNTMGFITQPSYSNGQYLYVIVRSVDTFELASSNANALSDIVEPIPTGLKELVFKRTQEGSLSISANYGNRALEVFALADAVLTRNRCIHVIAGQNGNAGNTSSIMTTTVKANTDYFSVAPYVTYTNLVNWETKTTVELLAEYKTQVDTVHALLIQHKANSGKPIICYEGGDEIYTYNSTEDAKALEFYNSPQMKEAYDYYGQSLANNHIEEMCFFQSNDGIFGTRYTILDTSSGKYQSINNNRTVGYIRGNN